MSSYWATSPMSSAPWVRKRARTSSMSSTANMMRRMPSVFTGAVFGSPLTAAGASNVLEPDDTVHPAPLDGHLALQLHTKFDKECLRSLEVLDHEENVVHSCQRHVFPLSPLLTGDARTWRLTFAFTCGGASGCEPDRQVDALWVDAL